MPPSVGEALGLTASEDAAAEEAPAEAELAQTGVSSDLLAVMALTVLAGSAMVLTAGGRGRITHGCKLGTDAVQGCVAVGLVPLWRPGNGAAGSPLHPTGADLPQSDGSQLPAVRTLGRALAYQPPSAVRAWPRSAGSLRGETGRAPGLTDPGRVRSPAGRRR